MRIAFIGKMMSGKTTSAEYLVRTYGFTRLAFADPVKHAAASMLNVLALHIYGQNRYDHDEHFWDYARIQNEKTNPRVRKLLQLVGTELGRELVGYEDVWVDLLMEQVEQHEHVVVDDCRFPNEAQALVDNGFRLVRVMRPEDERVAMVKSKYPDSYGSILLHPSETSLDTFEPWATVHAKNEDELRRQMDAVLMLRDNYITQ